MTILSNFNKQLIDLTKQLHEMYPNDNNVFTFYQSLLLLQKTNAKKAMDYFSIYVYIYKPQIMLEDESFFKNDMNYSEINNNYIPNLDNIIDILKSKWQKMNDNCKKNIWNYFKVLIIFKEQYDLKKI